ncbi:MAG: XRE family transcriptional regulator [uncultured bacterium]|nr:MAG: XRE family transcriptional regulator [uncultured bacterium]
MSALKHTIEKRKKIDQKFKDNYQLFEEGYQNFKLGVLLKMEREKNGITQEELAGKIGTKKSTVSRWENHAENMEIATLQKIAFALGKRLKIALM